jgi:phage host-nuclease inhibitor protein Gam
MATRAKKKVLTNISAEQAEQAFAQFAKSESRAEELTAKMEQRITKIREEYANELDELADSKREAIDILEVYAKEHEEFFSTKKSYEMTHGIIGYRTGTHKLGKLSGFTWDVVKEKVKKYLPDYIRTKEEVNKEGLIAERDNLEVAKQFSKCGIVVEQDETFYVQAKKETA